MKNLSLLYLLCYLLVSCSKPTLSENQVLNLHFYYARSAFDYYHFYPLMDFTPRRLLSLDKEKLVEGQINNRAELDSIGLLLSKSQRIPTDTFSCFNTDFVIILHRGIQDDTIGFSWDYQNCYILNNSLCKNQELSAYIIQSLCKHDNDVARYVDRCTLKGKYYYLSKPAWSYTEIPTPPFYACFSHESFARSVMQEDTMALSKIIETNPEYLNSDELCKILTSCIYFQQFDMIRYLLDHGENPENKDVFRGGNTALSIACENSNYIDALKILIDHGADVNAKKDGLFATPLQECIRGRNLDGVKILIDNGANMELKNKYGHTAFDLAMYLGYYKIAYYLIKNGCRFDCKKIKDGTYNQGILSLKKRWPEPSEDNFFLNQIIVVSSVGR